MEDAYHWQHHERDELSRRYDRLLPYDQQLAHDQHLAVHSASIAELFAKRWFKRRWVTQESISARSCMILIEAHACLPSVLETLATELKVALPLLLKSIVDFRGDGFVPDRNP